jgi:hypothetical protein
VALGDAIGLSDVPAVFEGDVPWDFEFTDTNDGDVAEGRSARSGIGLGDNQSSTFGFDGWVKVFCSSIGRLPLRKVPIDSGSILAEKSLKSGMPSSVESEHGVVLRSCFPKKGIMFVGLIEKMKLKLRVKIAG